LKLNSLIYQTITPVDQVGDSQFSKPVKPVNDKSMKTSSPAIEKKASNSSWEKRHESNQGNSQK
jgi:hypothetical protein